MLPLTIMTIKVGPALPVARPADQGMGQMENGGIAVQSEAPSPKNPAAIPLKIITAAFILLASGALKAGLIMVFAKVWGEKTVFSKALPFAGLTYVPFGLRNLLQSIAMTFTKAPISHKGLAALAASPADFAVNSAKLSYKLLTRVDIFIIWSAGLLFLLVKDFAKLPKKRAIMAAGIWWGLMVILVLISPAFI